MVAEHKPSLKRVLMLLAGGLALVSVALLLLPRQGPGNSGPLAALGSLVAGVTLPSDASGQGAGAPFPGAPSAASDAETVDLGQVPLGQRVTYAFQVRNSGEAPLVLENPTVEVLEGC